MGEQSKGWLYRAMTDGEMRPGRAIKPSTVTGSTVGLGSIPPDQFYRDNPRLQQNLA